MTELPNLPLPAPRRHLTAAFVAVVIFVAVATGGSVWARRLVARSFDSLTTVMAESKNDGNGDPNKATYLDRLNSLGTTLQREAFARADQLPLYGSSELSKSVPDKAGLFFRSQPSGFAVYPVGRPGTDSILFLQRIAALGKVTGGKRVALSLSPTWFFTGRPTEDAYLSNFSGAQALKSLLAPGLSAGFRGDLARRLLLHPASLESERLLRFLVTHMAGDGLRDRVACTAVWPLARMEQAIHTVQDRFEVALYIERRLGRSEARPAAAPSAALDWERLIAEASEQSSTLSDSDSSPPPSAGDQLARDLLFRDCLEHAQEWGDLELLLRGLQELNVHTLVLCMPPQEHYYERTGVTKESLALFSAKIRTLSARYGAEVEAFEDHAIDRKFQMGHGDHLSNRGWMYYNRVLDRFYHEDSAQLTNGAGRGHHKHARASADANS